MSVAAAYAECRGISRASGSTFYAGMRLLPADRRNAIFAIYALARRIDDIADGTLASGDKLAALAEIRAELSHLDETDNLVLRAVADAARRYPIPLDAFDDLVAGAEMDVRGHEYATFADTELYGRRVAGSIGRLTLGVFETSDRPRAESLAEELGVALQLTNILRDIREDYLGGRIYLPAEDFERFGCSLGNGSLQQGPLQHGPGEGANGDKLAALVEFEAQRASAWYAKGLALIPLLDWRSAASAGAMAGIYFRLLERIAATPRAVLERRMSLSTREKALVAARSLAVALRPRGAERPTVKGAAR
jgi:phytoene synthase